MGPRARRSPQFGSSEWSTLVFQGPSMVALDLGCQGRTCPWHSGLGPRNLVQVSKKRNLELVEILWDNGDFQFRGGQGKSTD